MNAFVTTADVAPMPNASTTQGASSVSVMMGSRVTASSAEVFYSFSAGTFFRRQNLTSKDDPRTGIIKQLKFVIN